jgi:hypothetical protein
LKNKERLLVFGLDDFMGAPNNVLAWKKRTVKVEHNNSGNSVEPGVGGLLKVETV